MLKRTACLTLALLACTSMVFAQVARNASDATISHTKSDFTNLSVNGLDQLGNPGYIAMSAVSTKSGYQTQYYLWVNESGTLCMASWQTIQAYASFPNGSWKNNGIGGSCTVVGSQSSI